MELCVVLWEDPLLPDYPNQLSALLIDGQSLLCSPPVITVVFLLFIQLILFHLYCVNWCICAECDTCGCFHIHAWKYTLSVCSLNIWIKLAASQQHFWHYRASLCTLFTQSTKWKWTEVGNVLCPDLTLMIERYLHITIFWNYFTKLFGGMGTILGFSYGICFLQKLWIKHELTAQK